MVDASSHHLRKRPVFTMAIVLLVSAFAVSAGAQDQPNGTLPVFHNDFGVVGLLQTPTARMEPSGQFSFSYTQSDPYNRYNFLFQPFAWMEAGFRYTQITNRQFLASSQPRDRLDKSVDLKFALIDEGRYMPRVALGFRDLGGTGLFGSEYFVANKRWYNLDFSLGIGWGYLGSRGNFVNPLRVFGNRFDQRVSRTSNSGGNFDTNQYFTGPASLFGGIQYQTPYKPLSLQIEYDGHDYGQEPLNNNQNQDIPINVSARYRVNDNLTLSAGLERGNTAMLGATLGLNLAHLSQPKNDPPAIVPKPTRNNASHDWQSVASLLAQNAGIRDAKITHEGDALVVEGELTRYRSVPEAELRANRILHNATGKDISEFRYRLKNRGLVMREDRLPRAPLPTEPLLVEPAEGLSDLDYRHGVTSVAASDRDRESGNKNPLYQSPGDRFSWSLRPGLNQNLGGPDGYLYQVIARLDSEFYTDENGWFSNTLAYSLFDNFDTNFNYIADSKLPRVRTFIGRYINQTTLGIYNLQYTRTARLSDNLFGMVYGGLLEQQYGGAGGEVLYRPFNSPVAFGLDVNWVKQRDFDTQFSFRDYSTVTGNATAYIDTGFKNVLATISVGRYLAKDIGTTLNFSRQFESGVRLGAFATFTDAGNKFGEGSFDKGIYVTIPLDLFYNKSTRSYTGFAYRPLTRDGGQQLARKYSLYGLTSERDLGRYWDNYQQGVNR